MKTIISIFFLLPLSLLAQKYQITKVDFYKYNDHTLDYETDGKTSYYQNSFVEITSTTINFTGEELNLDMAIKSSYIKDGFTIYTCVTKDWVSRVAFSLDKPLAILYADYDSEKDMFRMYSYLMLE